MQSRRRQGIPRSSHVFSNLPFRPDWYNPYFSTPAIESNGTLSLVGEFLGSLFAVEGTRYQQACLFHSIPAKQIRGTEESKHKPGKLLAQASYTVGDLLVDTPRLLRIDFALAELLFNGVETCEDESLAMLQGLSGCNHD